MIVSPSVSAIRKEKGVSGKNPQRFFPYDFNQPAAGNEARTRFPVSHEPPPAIRGNPASPLI